MPGPLPNPQARRRKANPKAGARVLSVVAPGDLEHVPEPHRELPPGTWRAATVRWWADVVASPMASEWTEVDWHGLRRLAVLVDTVEKGFAVLTQADEDLDVKERVACAEVAIKALSELRMQGALYGLTPIDRARLHWELDKGDKAKADRAQRSRPQAAPAPRPDPRRATTKGR